MDHEMIIKELKESEHRWQTLFQLLPVGISILDRNGNITESNPALQKILRLSQEDLDSKKYQGRKYIHTDGSPMKPEEFPSYTALTQKKIVRNKVIGVIHEDGSTTWTEVSAAPLSVDDSSCALVTTDITSRKLAEDSMLESKRQLNDAQMLAGLGSWEYDLATEKITWSDQVFRMYERDRSLGNPTPEEEAGYYDPEQASRLRNMADRVVLTGQKEDYEFTAQLKSGKRIIFAGSLRPVTNKEGKIIKLFGTLIDITERKKVEKTIQFHSDILDNIKQGICVVRMNDGIIVDTNKRFFELFGYQQNELIGCHVSILNAPGRRKPLDIANDIMDALAKTGSWQGEVKNIRKDKTVFWCRAHVTTMQHPEFGTVWITLQEDISQQKRSDDMLAEQFALLEQKNAALRELTAQLKIESQNVEDKIKKNLNNIILPVIAKLKQKSSRLEKEYISLVEENLKSITSSLGEKLSDKMNKLSQKEIEICGLLANGMTSKEIGGLLNISSRTVETHRNNIRKKLKIRRNINLITYLKGLNT